MVSPEITKFTNEISPKAPQFHSFYVLQNPPTRLTVAYQDFLASSEGFSNSVVKSFVLCFTISDYLEIHECSTYRKETSYHNGEGASSNNQYIYTTYCSDNSFDDLSFE